MEYQKLYDGGALYHFCAAHFLTSIRKKGLRFGVVPWGGVTSNIKLMPGYQWLTTNPEFKQTWNVGSSLPYDRTECRLTIILPTVERFNLLKWMEFGKDNPLFEDLNSFGDPENWWLFKGVVIPYWIADVNYKINSEPSVLINEK